VIMIIKAGCLISIWKVKIKIKTPLCSQTMPCSKHNKTKK
jgi:hypothetical protein